MSLKRPRWKAPTIRRAIGRIHPLPGGDRPLAEVEQGIRAALVERRRTSKDALDPGAKTGNYLNNLLALKEARLAGADDAPKVSQ